MRGPLSWVVQLLWMLNYLDSLLVVVLGPWCSAIMVVHQAHPLEADKQSLINQTSSALVLWMVQPTELLLRFQVAKNM